MANASSAGTISAHPILTLDAEASSGGQVNYNNTPKNSLKQNADSGGSIRQKLIIKIPIEIIGYFFCFQF